MKKKSWASVVKKAIVLVSWLGATFSSYFSVAGVAGLRPIIRAGSMVYGELQRIYLALRRWTLLAFVCRLVLNARTLPPSHFVMFASPSPSSRPFLSPFGLAAHGATITITIRSSLDRGGGSDDSRVEGNDGESSQVRNLELVMGTTGRSAKESAKRKIKADSKSSRAKALKTVRDILYCVE